MSLQRVQINNFRGGLNTRDGPFDLQPNESPDLLNVTISALVGQLKTREGKENYGTGVPAETIDYMKQCVVGANKRSLMLSINGNIYAANEAGVLTKLHAGTAGTIWDFEVFSDLAFKDWVYCSNGVDTPQKWDGEAIATVEWTVAKGALPNGGCLCVWENRMIISHVTATPQRIFFSEFGDPQAGNAEYGFLDVRGPEDDLDAVRDIAVLGSRLFILKRRSVFMVTNPASFISRRIGGPGVWDRFQVQEMEDKLYFFNPQGIWSTAGVAVTMESGQINNYFPKELNKFQLEKARLITTKDTYPRLLLAIATGASATNNKILELIPHINFRRIGGRRYLLLPAFMLHTIPAAALATWNPTGEEELVVAGFRVAPEENAFASIPVKDSLERAPENPLSNGGKWTKFTWAAKSLQIGEQLGKKGAIPTSQLGSEHGEAMKFEGLLTDVQASISCLNTGATEITWLFFRMANAEMSGYSISRGSSNVVRLIRWDKGVEHLLESWNTGAAGLSAQMGILMKGTTIHVWFKGESGWVELGSVVDATYPNGFTGIGAFGRITEGGLFPPIQQFSSEAPPQGSRLSILFKGETDEGQHIEAHWQSAYMAVQEQEPKERIRRVDVQLTGDALVEVFTDFEATPRFTEKLPTLGQVEESGEPSGEGLAYRFARVRPETHGRYHSIRFSTDPEGKPFSINGAEMAVRGGKEH